MKLSFRKIPSDITEAQFDIQLGSSFLSVTDTKFVLNVKSGKKQIFFEGEIYYQIKDGSFFTVKKNEYYEFLKKQIERFDVVSFINSVEGIYNGVYVDTEKNEVIIFCDYLNRKNFFYSEVKSSFVASTSLENIVTEFPGLKYNQHALLSYLSMGYTPIYQTFYEGISRFSNNEYVVITNGKVSHQFFSENYKIEDYDESYLSRYDELISNAVQSRSSENNCVLNSGGWDSTAIVYLLTKTSDTDKINSVVYETKLNNGDVYNIYEVDKVRRISEFYGIKSEKVQIDFNDKRLISDWENIKGDLKKYHTYFFVDMPKTIYDISSNDKYASIFSGEASDSIHNFGFSQVVSVSYDNRKLREYGDKMKSYLYSPSFFTKVSNNSYTDDKVFQFFKYYFNDSSFDNSEVNKSELLEKYFKSFMLSSERVPFARAADNHFPSDKLRKECNNDLSKNVFSNIVSDADAQNLYYYLLQLYRYYHFHSPQIEAKHSPLRASGNNCKIPFLDMSMVKFMYSMPESWGRGLELRPTKYPLKYLAKKKWKIPVDILEEKGAHSYISETDKKWSYSGGSWNINCEVIYDSVFSEQYKAILSEINLEKYFSPEYFKTDLMKKAVEDYINDKRDIANSGFIYKLGILFFIGLYE